MSNVRFVLLSTMCLVFIHGSEVSTQPLLLKQGGTATEPAVYDGKGMIIDLGVDVTERSWIKNGDVWTSQEALVGPEPIGPGQFTGLFVDEVPITIAIDKVAERARPHGDSKRRYAAASTLQPGQMVCSADGLITFRWPEVKNPQHDRVIVPPKFGVSCVTIACSHIIVKNITARHASNDGFNIHGSWVGIRLENIKAWSNADEGISAHEDVEMTVDGADIAWNGSYDAGVADVGNSMTSYTNCTVHDNYGAAFKLVGRKHRVSDIVIYHQAKDFIVGEQTDFAYERIQRR